MADCIIWSDMPGLHTQNAASERERAGQFKSGGSCIKKGRDGNLVSHNTTSMQIRSSPEAVNTDSRRRRSRGTAMAAGALELSGLDRERWERECVCARDGQSSVWGLNWGVVCSVVKPSAPSSLLLWTKQRPHAEAALDFPRFSLQRLRTNTVAWPCSD